MAQGLTRKHLHDALNGFKKDIDKSMDSLKDSVKAESKAGAYEAVREQKKECRKDNDGRYITAKECSDKMNTCKEGIYTEIKSMTPKRNSNGLSTRPNNRYDKHTDNHSNNGNDPTIRIVFSHFKNNKIGYGALGLALLELIGFLIYIFKVM